jgi:hypothetical protein
MPSSDEDISSTVARCGISMAACEKRAKEHCKAVFAQVEPFGIGPMVICELVKRSIKAPLKNGDDD